MTSAAATLLPGEIAHAPPPLSAEGSLTANRLREWLISDGARGGDPGLLLAGIAERLVEAGVPIDRMMSAMQASHAEYSGVGGIWEPGRGFEERKLAYDRDWVYRASPFAHVKATGRWLELRIGETPDDLFGIIPELKQAGITHYICLPLVFASDSRNGLTFATRRAEGFAPQHVALLRALLPTLSVVLDLRVTQRIFDHTLRFYVGDEPHRQIMAGTVRRGQVSRLRSAILVADMRGYTGRTYGLEPEEVVELLNAFFDCLVPPIEKAGGEVLKFMGDGLLATFSDASGDGRGCALHALRAAREALAAVAGLDGFVEAGIALHYGEAAYGNVGSGQRLDFTAVGRDVNVASRLARLNKTLGEPLLVSRAFASRAGIDALPLGAFEADGLPEPLEALRPAQA